MNYVGIDVSKMDFWASTGGNSKLFTQDKKGFKAFLKWLEKMGLFNAVLVMEATGVYHLRLATFLKDKGMLVDVVNPQRPYHHGRSQMARVVNDASAARNIEDFASKNGLKGLWEPMPDAVESLRWWLAQADKKSAEITRLRNQIESLEMRPSDTKNRIEFMERQIAEQQELLVECEKEAEALAAEYYPEERKLFKSIPGVGTKTSLALVGFFCSHYQIDNPKQALVLAGLSLKRHTSGSSIHKKERISKMGYGYLRKCLYMASLTAVKENPACKELYERLVAQGKKKKVALIAVACKLLRQSFGVWRSGNMFSVEKSKENFAQNMVAS